MSPRGDRPAARPGERRTRKPAPGLEAPGEGAFALVGRDLFATGLVSSRGGNLSLRRGDRLLITRRGCMLGHLGAGDLVEAGLEDGVPAPEEASSEVLVHRAIYRETPALAIVHAHPPSTVFLSLVEQFIIAVDVEGSHLLRRFP